MSGLREMGFIGLLLRCVFRLFGTYFVVYCIVNIINITFISAFFLTYAYTYLHTVLKIYTQTFQFFRKRVANIAILELGLLSNETSIDCGIHEFFNHSIRFFNHVLQSPFHRNSVKWQLQHKNRYFSKKNCYNINLNYTQLRGFKNSRIPLQMVKIPGPAQIAILTKKIFSMIIDNFVIFYLI